MVDKKKFKYMTNVSAGNFKAQQDFEIKTLRE